MNYFKGYVKKNRLWIGLICILLLIQNIYLFLMDFPRVEQGYMNFLEIFFAAVFFIVGLVLSYGHFNKVRRTAEAYLSGGLEFPREKDLLEKCYQELIVDMDTERRKSYSIMQQERQDLLDDYSIWVHQVKTPISAIKLMLQVERDCLNREDVVGELEAEMFQIEQYANMALQIQRISGTQNDFVIRRKLLDEIVRGVIHKYAGIMVRNKLSLHYDGCDEMVLTDEKWCSFLIEQIMSNAIKYSKKGTITIETKRENEWCYLSISDEGMGIREEDLPRVFEKGYTGYNGHIDRRSTGIGLYLCKKMAKKLGHTIQITSKISQGTCVTLGFSMKKIDVRD